MKPKWKKSLATVLAAVMLLSAIPFTAFADEAELPDEPATSETGNISDFDEVTPEPTIVPDMDAAPVPDSTTPPNEAELDVIATPAPTETPKATEMPEPTEAPAATPSSDVTTTPEPSPAPEATETPEASVTPEPTQEPSPTPTPIADPVKLEYEFLSDYETGGLFLFPAPYADEITQEYSSDHPAWDIAASMGSPVVAAADGVVTDVQIWNGDTTGSMSYGHMVQIKHGDELTTLYAHLSEINVSVGDHVVRGQRIGRVGSTGNSTGPHLHLEFITSDGEKVNPDWLLEYGVDLLLSPDLPYSTVKEWCNHPNGTRTISDFGVTREEVVAELSAHEDDGYYLGTAYQGYDWQSPNGDPSYNDGIAKMNCGGFVAYVLDKCGLNSGTADLWTHSASPTGSVQWYMTQDGDVTGGAWWDWNGSDAVHDRMLMSGAANYSLWVRNADLVAYTYETKTAMLSSGVLEKGDIIIMIPKTAGANGFNDSHIGFFWGDTSSEDKIWHSDGAGNRISTIQPKTADSSFVVVKYGQPTYDITLTKTSANVSITNGNSNYSLAGAKYNVYIDRHISNYDYSKDTPVATFTTDANGKANLSKKLEDGDYVVIEATAPRGYALDKTVHQITINGGNTTLHVVDDPGTIRLVVSKKDSGTNTNVAAGNASLAGAVYRVTYQENGVTVSKDITTNAQGVASLREIPLGTVTVQEIIAPTGYKLDSTIHTYTITTTGTSAYFQLEPEDFTEEVIMGKIQLHKQYEELNGTFADEEGAEFQVYLKSAGSYDAAKEAERDTITTSASGYAVTKDMPFGTYIVHQSKGGAGREFIEDFEVVISEDGQTYSYELTNALKNGQFRIVKTSDDGNIAGIQFRVTRLADNYSKVYTTDADGLILTEALPIFSDAAGENKYQYLIEELDTEETYGYALPAPQIVTLTEGSTAEVTFHNSPLEIGTTAKFENGEKETAAAQFVTLIDTVSYTGLVPNKEYTVSGVLMDKATGKELLIDGEPVTAEAVFTPEKSDGTVDVEFVFDARELLSATETVVFETLYRDGTELAVHADIEDEGQTVTIEPLHGAVTTTKVNADDPEDKISGAVFGVYLDTDKNGVYDPETDELVGTLEEVETGVYQLDDLLFGNYLLHEDTAPEGFVQDVIYYPFQITEDGQTVVFETTPGAMFPNKPIRGSVTTTKVNADDPNDKLSGAVFGIYVDKNGNGKLDAEDTRVGVMDESEKGVYTFSDLVYNHYLIHEDKAPEGFVRDDNYYPFQITEDGQTVVFETTPGAMFPNKPENIPPKTGDNRNLFPAAIIGFASLCGLTAVLLIRRKKQRG